MSRNVHNHQVRGCAGYVRVALVTGKEKFENFLPISILYSQLIYRNLREVTPHARTGIAQRVNLYDQWLVLSPRLLVSRPGEATQQLNAKSQNITVTSTICV